MFIDLFDGLMGFFQHTDFLPKFKDLAELKEQGELIEETETNGDTTTRRIHFKSFDGGTEITRQVTTNKLSEQYSKIVSLKKQIHELLESEKFEEAIPLRDELKLLEAEVKPKKKLN